MRRVRLLFPADFAAAFPAFASAQKLGRTIALVVTAVAAMLALFAGSAQAEGTSHAWLCNSFGGIFVEPVTAEKADLATTTGNKPANYLRGATSGQVAVSAKGVTVGYLSCAVPTGATAINDAAGVQMLADNDGWLYGARWFDSQTIVYPAYTAGP